MYVCTYVCAYVCQCTYVCTYVDACSMMAVITHMYAGTSPPLKMRHIKNLWSEEDVAFEALLEKRVHQDYDKDC